nr:hypothetical protein [Tanacetum cinerariifolium]
FVSSLRRDVRGGEESAQLSWISDLLDIVVLSNMGGRRFWDVNGDGCFRVKDVRRMLDDMLLPKSDVPSRWVKQIPIKGRLSYARVMIELRADMELKDSIIVDMPIITREGHYTCNFHFEYEWKPPMCASCKVFGHIHEECLKNTGGAGDKKTVKKPSQTSRGVPVGLKIGFKPQKEYQHVLKKSTANSNGHMKKGVKPTIEVSNSNPFGVLNLIDNDVEFGTIGGLLNWYITSLLQVDPLLCMSFLRGIVESNSKVKVVFNETANIKILTSCKDESDKGYGTNSLLEQWRDSYSDNDDYDPYDDD